MGQDCVAAVFATFVEDESPPDRKNTRTPAICSRSSLHRLSGESRDGSAEPTAQVLNVECDLEMQTKMHAAQGACRLSTIRPPPAKRDGLQRPDQPPLPRRKTHACSCPYLCLYSTRKRVDAENQNVWPSEKICTTKLLSKAESAGRKNPEIGCYCFNRPKGLSRFLSRGLEYS